MWVRISPGVQTGRIHVCSGFFKSEEGARLNKALTDVAERYLTESLKVTETPKSLLNASVAQSEDGNRLKPCTVAGSNPPGGTNGPVAQLEDGNSLKICKVSVRIRPGLQVWHDICRLLPWVALCRRYIRIERQNGSVVQLARHACLRNMYIDTLWVRIPPGLPKLNL